jgi:penicillin-binding protein 1A
MATYVVRFARRALIVTLFVLAAAAGIASGLVFAFADDLPQISALDDYAPSTITRVQAIGGEVVGEFATQRRVVIGYDDIPVRLRQALIAAEDAGFDQHFGFSVTRLVITAARDLMTGRRAGASTLTQQLARNLFPDTIGFRKTPERKIKEALVTIQIEKRYTKREILTLYCNHVYFGHGAYGVESAARLYFNKRAKDLSLEEAALIAGLVQLPERQSPYVDMARATKRRNYVLQRMAEEGYITPAEAQAAKARPIVVRGQAAPDTSAAPYFVEEVRKYLEHTYGAKKLYEQGLVVQTSLDLAMQEAANKAIDNGLRRVDKRRGFRRPKRNLVDENVPLDTFKTERWDRPIAVGDIVPAVVLTAVPAKATGSKGAAGRTTGTVQLRIGRYDAELPKEGYAWTRKTSPAFLRTGDLIEVRVTALNDATDTAVVELEQTPIIEGALLVLDNRSGQVRAMVGGYSFARSKFNRAVQAYRQMGSTFKPIVYTAAIDRGYTPTSTLLDAPVAYPAGPGQPVYSPQNYDRKFEGPVTLRHALEDSRNVPTVRLLEALTPKTAIEYAHRFGFTNQLPPYLSLGLGSAEETLIEVTSAYTVFPNQGVRMTPYDVLKVLDREGNLLEENRPEPHDAIRADTAYVMTNLLRGVTERGTAAAAKALDWPIGGKTGTMDEYTDAWFIGFDPDITVGVWVGYDEKKPIGHGETGAQAALPIWMDFMKAYIARRGREKIPTFVAPGNIVFLAVDRGSGTPSDSSDAANAINEAFISGTEPGSQGRVPALDPAAAVPPSPPAGPSAAPSASPPAPPH